MKRDELYVGVDLGGTNVRAAVIDIAGHVLGQEKHRLLSREPPQVAEAVVRAAKTACGAAAPRRTPGGTISRRGRATTCASRWPRRGRRASATPQWDASCSRSSASRTR